MASFTQMEKEKIIKRADMNKVKLQDIHIEPGFNLEGRNDGNSENDESLFQYIMSGGILPNLEVRPRNEGGVWIVDGHRRYTQLCRAVAAGAPLQDKKDNEVWIPIVHFVGNDIERTFRLFTSNEKESITAIQTAKGYARLAKFGVSPDDIAKGVQKTRQHVDQMLILAGANHDVHNAITNETISATAAINVVREHGESAGKIIDDAAKKSGGKVTAKTIKPWSPPAKLLAPMVKHAHSLIEHIQPEIIARAGSLKTFNEPDEIISINVSIKSLFFLIQNLEATNDAKEDAEQKLRDKAAKASQAKIQLENVS